MGRRRLVIRRNILRFPNGDNQRFKRALDLYSARRYADALTESIALIDDGYGHAYTLAGAIYEEGGNGVQKDLEKALFYYQKAVDEVGAVEGWLALGRLHYFGKGVPQDYQKAFYYYSIVAEDTENAVACLMLGRMYKDGSGVKKDLTKARTYLVKAIEMGAVFALTYLGLLEQECGNFVRGIFFRGKAAYLAFRITRKDPDDPRLRQW